MPTNVSIVSTRIIRETIEYACSAGVNEVASRAHQQALKDVPVRKVFRYGRGPRTGERVQGRQDTRPLSIQEALAEAGTRRKLGLPSAFEETASGRRRLGSQPLVQTALFPGNYRTRDRANSNDSRSLERRQAFSIAGRNRLVTLSQSNVLTSRGIVRTIQVPEITEKSREAESDLSARGRYELKRRKNSAIVKLPGEQGKTLGGALRKSLMLVDARPGGKLIKATISAGNEEVTYAKYVEFGTRRSRAQPFLRPALAQAREELMETVMANLRSLGGE